MRAKPPRSPNTVTSPPNWIDTTQKLMDYRPETKMKLRVELHSSELRTTSSVPRPLGSLCRLRLLRPGRRPGRGGQQATGHVGAPRRGAAGREAAPPASSRPPRTAWPCWPHTERVLDELVGAEVRELASGYRGRRCGGPCGSPRLISLGAASISCPVAAVLVAPGTPAWISS